MARRNVRLLRHKTEESSGKLTLDIKGGRDRGTIKSDFLIEYLTEYIG